MSDLAPIYESLCLRRRLDPMAWAVLVRRDIEQARDHTGGRPWPDWDRTEPRR